MKRQSHREISELSNRQIKRLVNQTVSDASNPRNIISAPSLPGSSKGPSSVTITPPTEVIDQGSSILVDQISQNVTINSAVNDSSPPVVDCHPGSHCLSETFDLNTFEAGSSDFDVAACLASFDNEFSKLISDETDSNFKEYLLVCDTCKRCSMCSCYLGCSECDHSDTEGACVHCDKCVHDWLLIEGAGDDETHVDDSSSNETDTSDTSEGEEQLSIKDDLAGWAAESPNISHTNIKGLLDILRKHHPEDNLPKDPRTLLRTVRNVEVQDVPPGKYWHMGIKNHLAKLFSKSKAKTIKLNFGMDGLPISKSSGSCLWPILCSVQGMEEVFLCGVYHGYTKPDSSSDFLREMVEEVCDLVTNGVEIGDQHFKVALNCVICDAPAKAFILNIKFPNGYYSCTRCCQKGQMHGSRMSFPQLDYRERTDESFIARDQKEHHHGQTCLLLKIPGFQPVSSVVIDPMHLLDLGVAKKILLLLTIGGLNVRMGKNMFDEISKYFTLCGPFIPCEFSGRKLRPLELLRRYKAAELRLFLNYVGPIALRKLKACIYENFMCLHVAVRLLSCRKTCYSFNDYAAALMKTFVANFKAIYGEEYVSHNIHNCLHINQDVLRFGPLDEFSAFKFENFMQKLKKLVRKGDRPLQQIAKRYSEIEAAKVNKVSSESKLDGFSKEHSGGPLVAGCGFPKYKVYKCGGFELNVDHKADSCVGLSDGSVVEIKDFAYHAEKGSVLIGCSYRHKEDLYSYPCQSSSIGVFKVHGLSPLKCWPVKMISEKFVRLPYGKDTGTFVVLPLLHIEKCKF